ncbi:GRIP and coiled-coil domain-containing protein 1 [Aphelenchoides bicaudatus]|nr:GRIP and coiled-coil domain-containing protein 1 [Aphelenchoides bicaudatus]
MSTDLKAIIDEQKLQLESYEKKLKKKALEIAVGTLSGNENATSATASASEASDSGAEAPSPIDALKQALTTLTVESKRKEMAFQADRKALLTKNEKLQTMIDSMQMNAASKPKDATKYKEQIRRIEEEKEKLIADHGAMLSNMQKRYAEEATKVKQHEKTITDLYTKIHSKDQQIQANATIVTQFEKIQDEMLRWKKRAEQTPREEALLQEISNLKELQLEQNKRQMNKTVESGLDSRLQELESRVTELTQRNANFEHERFELTSKIDSLEKELATAKKLGQEKETQPQHKNNKLAFVKLYEKLKMTDNFNLYELLGIERPQSIAQEPQKVEPTTPTQLSGETCEKCETSHKDLVYFKAVINRLQNQLKLLEQSQNANKTTNEEMISSLRKRITELEEAQLRTYNQLTSEAKRRVAELEEEMQKQRERMQQIIAEKDREIEIAKNSLFALYGSPKNANDPVDPQQSRSSPEQRTAAPVSRQRSSAESVRSVLASSFAEDEAPGGFRAPVRRTISNHHGDSRNFFYEQELAKCEQEILELRNMVRLSEMKVGDMNQASLTKDMQFLEIIDHLKEEIRVLEGRLTLQNTNANIEYLRNIFVQFLNSTDGKARKYMLRAIGGVLKLTSLEMRQIDNYPTT